MNENDGSGASGGKRLLRPKDGRLVAGVCAGLAAYFGIDVNLVRLGFGIFSVFYGLGVFIYVIAWAVLPDESGGSSGFESLLRRL